MNKRELLNKIQCFAHEGLITKEEVIEAFNAVTKNGTISTKDRRITPQATFSFFSLLSYIGAIIATLGIGILVWDKWIHLDNVSKISLTLGVGVFSYCVALILSKSNKFQITSNAFNLISGVVIPIGLLVTFDIIGLDVNNQAVQAIISAILVLLFAFFYVVSRSNISVIFVTLFCTWLFLSSTSLLFTPTRDTLRDLFHAWTVVSYKRTLSLLRIALVGFVYMLIGYYLKEGRHKALTNFFYGLGAIFLLGTILRLGQYKPYHQLLWQIAFPIVTIAVLIFGLYVKNRLILILGYLFFVLYILKISVEHFSQTISWHLMLVLIGLSLIIISALFFKLTRRYIEQ